MRSSRRDLSVVLALGLSACGFDAAPEPVAVEQPVGSTVRLTVDEAWEPNPDREVDWVIEHRPEGSASRLDDVSWRQAELWLDRSGAYAVDRWVRLGASESWTHRFYVDALPSAPVARASGPTSAAVGEAILLDGGASEALEGMPLTYLWRLVDRPRDSAAGLDDTSAVQPRLTPDLEGTYNVELHVFDGTLWSEEPAVLTITAGPE